MKIATLIGMLVAFGTAGAASPASAQSFPFEQSFDASGPLVLDVSTMRGKIGVSVGEEGRVRVAGTVTVRAGWDVPANAVELARRVAQRPPIERAGSTIRLRDPSDAAERRAVTVSYDVRVPPNTGVVSVSGSGATTVRGLTGPVSVRTQSAAITLARLGGTTDVATGSGAVDAEDIAGALSVQTASSGFTGRTLGGTVRIRSQSGAVNASFAGSGAIDVETGSSSVRLQRVGGALNVATQSGRVTLEGAPRADWNVTTGSGSVSMALDRGTGFAVDASNRSGSIDVEGATLRGSLTKGKAAGTVEGGGPLIRVTSRSGSIRFSVN